MNTLGSILENPGIQHDSFGVSPYQGHELFLSSHAQLQAEKTLKSTHAPIPSVFERFVPDPKTIRSWIVLVDADCFRPLKIPVEVSLNMLGFDRVVKFKRGERALVYLDRSKSSHYIRSYHYPFVIVVQWREAKSCMELFEKCSDPSMGYNMTMIAIICDNGCRSFESAERWIATLPMHIYKKILLCQTWADAYASLVVFDRGQS
jgi:hypothetical protein